MHVYILICCSVMHAEEQELTSQLVFKDSWQWATQMTQDHLKDYVVFHGDGKHSYLCNECNVIYNAFLIIV